MTRSSIAAHAGRQITYLDEAASNVGREYKQHLLCELRIAPGHVVLDVGCGPGTDRALARLPHALTIFTATGRVPDQPEQPVPRGDTDCYVSIMECFVCHNNDHFDQLPPRERIAADPHWREARAFNTSLPGWLVLVPRRHVTSIAELDDAEAAALGTWQVRLSRALHDVTGCMKTYVMQFAEQEGFGHVHFHVVPRMPDIPDDHRGPPSSTTSSGPRDKASMTNAATNPQPRCRPGSSGPPPS